MQDIREYWDGKNNRAEIAKEHTIKMNHDFKNEINKAVENTKKYSEFDSFSMPFGMYNTVIDVLDKDSVSALIEESPFDRMAVLNFASYKNPGGGFLLGSRAQEESLCHESFLYNVLEKFQEYYENNSRAKNKALYKNRALYSRDILFQHNNVSKMCDVITCASPNLTTAKRYCNVSDAENYKVMTSRIRFVLNIANEQGADTLILGAYGCGVFGQDPTTVAKIFKQLLDTEFKGVFRKIVFAIPDGRNQNLNAFKSVFL